MRHREYATALGLVEGSDEWYEFFDTAAAAAGRIPPDLAANQDLIQKMPVLFRTLRGDAVPQEELDALLEKLRDA